MISIGRSRAAAVLVAMLLATQLITGATPAAATGNFVTRNAGRLYLQGQPWELYGASIYHLSNPGGAGVESQVFGWATGAGINTLRIVNMFDESGTSASAPYSASDWSRVDQLLADMAGAGLHAILDLSAFRNFLVHRDIAAEGWGSNCAPGGDRTPVDYSRVDPYRLDLSGEWDAFLTFVTQRVNTVSGVAYRNDPTIALVSIAGEALPPNSEECGKAVSTAELTDFYARTFASWRSLDSNHLLSNGGFIHLDWEERYGNPNGSGIDWKAIFALPQNDVPAIHVYPDYSVSGSTASFTDYQTPKVAPYVASLGKPWLAEEFGFPQSTGDAPRASLYDQIYDMEEQSGAAGVAFWNLAYEVTGSSFDVNPSTPLTWAAVVRHAPDFFRSPVDGPPVLNVVKAGRTVPLKWRLLDSNGQPVTNLASVQVSVTTLPCSAGTTTDIVEETASGNSGLQNLGDGNYQFNWGTPKGYANSCKRLTLSFPNGLDHRALFKFTK